MLGSLAPPALGEWNPFPLPVGVNREVAVASKKRLPPLLGGGESGPPKLPAKARPLPPKPRLGKALLRQRRERCVELVEGLRVCGSLPTLLLSPSYLLSSLLSDSLDRLSLAAPELRVLHLRCLDYLPDVDFARYQAHPYSDWQSLTQNQTIFGKLLNQVEADWGEVMDALVVDDLAHALPFCAGNPGHWVRRRQPPPEVLTAFARLSRRCLLTGVILLAGWGRDHPDPLHLGEAAQRFQLVRVLQPRPELTYQLEGDPVRLWPAPYPQE